MTVTLEQFKKNPGVPPGIAAGRLGICRQRMNQLLAAGKLEIIILDGERFVSVASLLARERRLQKRGQKRPSTTGGASHDA
jgi:hypothetical protein